MHRGQRICTCQASAFMRLPAAIGAAIRSTPVETGGSHSGGRKATLLTSIWRTITEDRFNDQEASQARIAAQASWRTSPGGEFAGTRTAKSGEAQPARRLTSDTSSRP